MAARIPSTAQLQVNTGRMDLTQGLGWDQLKDALLWRSDLPELVRWRAQLSTAPAHPVLPLPIMDQQTRGAYAAPSAAGDAPQRIFELYKAFDSEGKATQLPGRVLDMRVVGQVVEMERRDRLAPLVISNIVNGVTTLFWAAREGVQLLRNGVQGLKLDFVELEWLEVQAYVRTTQPLPFSRYSMMNIPMFICGLASSLPSQV